MLEFLSLQVATTESGGKICRPISVSGHPAPNIILSPAECPYLVSVAGQSAMFVGRHRGGRSTVGNCSPVGCSHRWLCVPGSQVHFSEARMLLSGFSLKKPPRSHSRGNPKNGRLETGWTKACRLELLDVWISFGAVVDTQRPVTGSWRRPEPVLVRSRRTRSETQGARAGLASFPQSAELSLAWHRD